MCHCRSFRLLRHWMSLLGALWSAFAWGTEPGGPVPHQVFDPASPLRDHERRLQDLERQQRLDRLNGSTPSSHSVEAAAAARPDPHCWRTLGVRVKGNRLLDATTLREMIEPVLRPCMGKRAINEVLRRITQGYVAAGYPASRPYLAQVPEDGQPLSIRILEGYVESIALLDPLPLWLEGAFPTMLGKPLYLPDLEQGLDQLNRLRAYDLTAEVMPGSMEGASRVELQGHQVARRWHVDSRLDNLGSDLTGRDRLSLGVGVDSPLGLNDDLRLSTSLSGRHTPGYSSALSLYHSLPYGPWTLALTASQARYRAELPGGTRFSQGQTRLYGLRIERLLWRDQYGLLSASLRLDHKRQASYLAWSGRRIRLDVQSPTLTTLEAGLNAVWRHHALWSGYVGVAQGLPWFGADQVASGRYAPDPGFRAYRASLSYLTQGPEPLPWQFQSELNLQYSTSILHGLEQLALTDDRQVRGFLHSTVSGASGAVWRNTLSHRPALIGPASVGLHLGLDGGWSRYTRGSTPQRLVGSALGMTVQGAGMRLRLDYQRPLVRPHKQTGPARGIWVAEWSSNF